MYHLADSQPTTTIIIYGEGHVKTPLPRRKDLKIDVKCWYIRVYGKGRAGPAPAS